HRLRADHHARVQLPAARHRGQGAGAGQAGAVQQVQQLAQFARGVIKLPVKAAKKFDYEVELQVIIGKTARDVSEAEALDYVFGYATGNDFSARDLQLRDGRQGSQFMIGKTPDGFFPVGPYLVGAELVGDPQKLAIECSVNGERRQSSNTSDMIFSVAKIIAYAS